MAADLCTLRERRDALLEAIHSGVQSASVDGVATQFQDVADMRAVLADLNAQIAQLEGRTVKRPRSAQVHLGGF